MATPNSTAQPSLVTSTLLAVAIVFPVLGTIAVCLRIFVKTTVKKQKLFWDDWVCALAQLAAWGISIDIYVAAGLAGTNYTHSSLSPLSASIIFLRTLWIEGFPLVFSLSLVKIAILLFYARIFTTFKFKLAVYIYIGILAAWCVSMTVCQLLAANPIQNAWNPLSTAPLRFDYNDFSLAFAGMSMVFDLIVLCFPFPVIHKLQMTYTRKVQVMGVFWLGIFCCISSAVRFYFLYSEISQSVADTGPDRYLKVSTAFIWGTIEPNTSIIAACLPCYAPFFAKGRGIQSLLANLGSLFSSVRGSKAKIKHSSNDSLEFAASYQLQKPNSVPWDQYDGYHSSFVVDVERTRSIHVDQEPLKDFHPSQIKVTRDFTRTESVGN